jgi:hypothetical protein
LVHALISSVGRFPCGGATVDQLNWVGQCSEACFLWAWQWLEVGQSGGDGSDPMLQPDQMKQIKMLMRQGVPLTRLSRWLILVTESHSLIFFGLSRPEKIW